MFFSMVKLSGRPLFWLHVEIYLTISKVFLQFIDNAVSDIVRLLQFYVTVDDEMKVNR